MSEPTYNEINDPSHVTYANIVPDDTKNDKTTDNGIDPEQPMVYSTLSMNRDANV